MYDYIMRIKNVNLIINCTQQKKIISASWISLENSLAML